MEDGKVFSAIISYVPVQQALVKVKARDEDHAREIIQNIGEEGMNLKIESIEEVDEDFPEKEVTAEDVLRELNDINDTDIDTFH